MAAAIGLSSSVLTVLPAAVLVRVRPTAIQVLESPDNLVAPDTVSGSVRCCSIFAHVRRATSVSTIVSKENPVMLKLNIGFNRKLGEANFSSRGASVNLEIEVESGVVREPDKLQAKIDYLFKLAKASVDAAAERHQSAAATAAGHQQQRREWQ